MTDRLGKRTGKPALDLRPAGFFVLRSPLLPFAALIGRREDRRAPRAVSESSADLAEALSHDRRLDRFIIERLIERADVRDALFVAAPLLLDHVADWKAAPHGKRGMKVERSLVKYLARMSTRCTPFGLFAGCTVGGVGEDTNLEIPAIGSHRRYSRLDMGYLAELTHHLARDPQVRNELRFFLNSSLHDLGEQIHVIESRVRDGVRQHELVAIDVSDDVRRVLDRARAGGTLHELAASLVDEEITHDDAAAFIAELIDCQILVPNLTVPVTGHDPIDAPIAVLATTSSGASQARILASVRSQLAAIDEEGIGAAPERYYAIARCLTELPVEVDVSRLFQVDMTKPATDARLGSDVVAEVARAAECLFRIYRPGPDPLGRFREAFRGRYDRRRVPLLEVLDEEVGIGFPPPVDSDNRQRFDAQDRALIEWYGEARAKGDDEIVLTDQHIDRLATGHTLEPPDAMGALISLGSSSATALDRGDFSLHLKWASACTGAAFMGRFLHMDSSLEKHVRKHLQAEEALNPDAVHAEIVHLPQGRTGNVIFRPVLRGYEIPFLGSSGAPLDRQIPVADLSVFVDNGRVALFSERLQLEVIPRLTNAHAFRSRRNLHIYRFLCSLQWQGDTFFSWSWGAVRGARFLPRVRYGRTYLSARRWILQRSDLIPLEQSGPDDRYCQTQQLRARLRLPRVVLVEEGDRRLPLDFDSVLSVDAFVNAVKRRPRAVLAEMLPSPDQLCVTGPDGLYTNEIIIPFERIRAPSTPSVQRPVPSGLRKQRSFPPGSEWLYVKWYSGPGIADRLLRRVVGPIARRCMESDMVDCWFYVRYADPDPHLRLRFHGDGRRLLHEVLPMLNTAAAAEFGSSRIWRMQLDTYEREVERYGGMAGVRFAERLFHIDSETCIDIIALSPGGGGQIRKLLALAGIDGLMSGFGLGIEAREELFSRFQPPSRELRDRWNESYRAQRSAIEAALTGRPLPESELQQGVRLLKRRSERIAALADEVPHARMHTSLGGPSGDILLSHAHMFVNRLLREHQPIEENAYYYYLSRTYRSWRARDTQKVLA